jgi:ATP-binding cassette subfamily F protein uup
MRAERAARRDQIDTVRLEIEQAEQSGKMVFEARSVSKAYEGVPVVADFSTRIMRGDRIGVVGPNGAGKTTLLRLLIGELAPDTGEVLAGGNVQVAYYDQQREQLDPDRTVFDTIGDGNDTVTANGRTRHVHAYLRDFLFSNDRARSPVKALSGGERNRLLLARLFTRPANVLVLDEPTNDLDLETLELLEAQLAEWPGTLLLVSHDRVFLDNVVTSTFLFDGEGHVQEYVGGYSDLLRQRPGDSGGSGAPGRSSRSGASERPPQLRREAVRDDSQPRATAVERKKLSYKEQRELESLPARIEALEAEQRRLNDTIAGPDFYKEPRETIHETLARVDELRDEIESGYRRWQELEQRANPGVEK